METVLIGYDGSECAHRAIVVAAELYPEGQHAVVVNVWTPPLPPDVAYAGFAPVVPPFESFEGHKRRAREAAEQLAADGADAARAAGFDAEPLAVTSGKDVASTLAALATEIGAGAIVAGAHHRGPLRAMIHGSVTLGLLHDAEQPVVVVPPKTARTGEAA